MSVAAFYRKMMVALSELGIEIKIFARPVEVEVAIPFEIDEQHSSYERPGRHPLLACTGMGGPDFQGIPCPLHRKSQPGAFFLGRIRSAVTRFPGESRPSIRVARLTWRPE